jgi:hypothetical protein
MRAMLINTFVRRAPRYKQTAPLGFEREVIVGRSDRKRNRLMNKRLLDWRSGSSR